MRWGLAPWALDVRVIPNVGAELALTATEARADLTNTTASSAIAGGGVRPLVLRQRPPRAEEDRVDVVFGVVFVGSRLELDDAKSALMIPDNAECAKTALPNSSSDLASGPPPSPPPQTPRQPARPQLSRGCRSL